MALPPLRQRRTIELSNSTDYADYPPPTPSPNNEQYPDFQHQQEISASNSRVNLHTSYASYQSLSTLPQDEAIPSYAETMNRTNSERSLSFNFPSHAPTPRSLARNTSVTADIDGLSPMNLPTPNANSDATQAYLNNGSNNNISAVRPSATQNLKLLGLNFLNARQHLALATCRDSVLLPPLYHSLKCFKRWLTTDSPSPLAQDIIQLLISPNASEHFIAGIWCLVAAYLSYSVIDGLMVRWIVTYQTSAAIFRVLSMSMFLITIEQAALSIFSPDGAYTLHTWILISCVLTGAYILQNFVTSNLDLKGDKKPRSVDYYNIAVFAVVPVGVASFISMIGLLRLVFILRLDLGRKDLLVQDIQGPVLY